MGFISLHLARLFPFLTDRDIDSEDYRRRLFVLIGSAISLPVFLYFAYLEFSRFSPMWWGLIPITVILLLVNLVLITKDQFSPWGPRAIVILAMLMVTYSITQAGHIGSMNWALVMPVVSLFLFGPREGCIWAIGFLIVSTALILYAEPMGLASFGRAEDEYFFSYLFLTAFAFGYEVLRRREESIAEERARRLERVVNTSSDWTFELDENLNVTYLSDQWEKITGISTESIIGNFAPEPFQLLRSSHGEAYQEALLAHRPFRNMLFSLKLADDRIIRFTTRGSPTFDEQGRFSGYTGSGTDMTEMEESRLKLREQEQQLQQSQKMEAIGQLTSGIAHDFNNLLTVIRGYVELMMMQDVPDRRMLASVEQATDRASQLTNRLLTFSKDRARGAETIDLRETLQDLAGLLERTLGETIDITWALGDQPLIATVDLAQFENAILNLAINARDAMPLGGILKIDASVSNSGKRAFVRVTDTGEGIPQNLLDRVTEPFFSSKPDGKGTGLGLTMINGFVRQFGGTLEIHSEVDVGTSVLIALPKTERRVTPRIANEAIIDDASEQVILIVEDDPDVSRILIAMLSQSGYRPEVCNNALDALKQIEVIKPDILLSDIVLGGTMNGVDLARTVEMEYPDIKILLMTGYSAGHDTEGFEVLPKPFSRHSLVTALQNAPSSSSSDINTGTGNQ